MWLDTLNIKSKCSPMPGSLSLSGVTENTQCTQIQSTLPILMKLGKSPNSHDITSEGKNQNALNHVELQSSHEK